MADAKIHGFRGLRQIAIFVDSPTCHGSVLNSCSNWVNLCVSSGKPRGIRTELLLEDRSTRIEHSSGSGVRSPLRAVTTNGFVDDIRTLLRLLVPVA